MISLASIIERFEADYLAQYPQCALHNQRQALDAMKRCRSTLAPRMLAQCGDCGEQRLVPHSCGHRFCPHCQHHESQRWIECQTQRLVPGSYFLITFTLPAELRCLAWQHQRILYAALMDCAWATLHTFSQNHKQLQGSPGAVAVLHTHSRQLAFHPHVHLAMPAAALDAAKGLWRTLRRSSKGAGYLFNHKALAKVFRAKLLATLHEEGLTLPSGLPELWVVDCKAVGNGEKALVYLGRYLYRGVIQERDILRCENGQVTYRWRDSKTGKMVQRTVSGATFLWLVLQHVLPKGFRRARNYGILHPNSKRLIALLRLLVFKQSNAPTTPPTQTPRPQLLCRCCGAAMAIVRRRILPPTTEPPPQHEDQSA
ncbi:MAG: transposase [Rhodoferax sp.]|nr:transposase [Rhodoferax sp.]